MTRAPYLPEIFPVEHMDRFEQQFWARCAQRRLMFQRCGGCGRPRNPPGHICPRCHSTAFDWFEAPKAAEVFTYTIIAHPVHDAVRQHVPYNVAIVVFPGLGDLRFVTNLLRVPSRGIRIGEQVALEWEALGNGFVPRFAYPAEGDA
jgi:uncharacterized protein